MLAAISADFIVLKSYQAWNVVIAGPLVTAGTVAAVVLLNEFVVTIPNPGALTNLAVIFSAYCGGTFSGLTSAVISVAYAATLFSDPNHLFHYDHYNLARLSILIFATPAAALMVGTLKASATSALARERSARQNAEAINKELTSLRAALDQSDVGIALLDHELRAQFVNRAYRRIWHVPDALAGGKPAFIELMYHARDAGRYALPVSEVDAFISNRLDMVRAGDETPLDLRLSDGSVIRFRCKVLSDGGRMLNYGNVSDLVHQADELAAQAATDPMTGIYNRYHFQKQLKSEWARYLRYSRPVSLLMLDIDQFKSINDRFGHDVGDQVITFVARMCRRDSRNSDTAARIGGEEFVLLLPETGLNDASIVAERLRTAIAEKMIPCGRASVRVTVSIGVATADPLMNEPADLVRRADDLLYAAKRSGKNRIIASPNELHKPVDHLTVAQS